MIITPNFCDFNEMELATPKSEEETNAYHSIVYDIAKSVFCYYINWIINLVIN